MLTEKYDSLKLSNARPPRERRAFSLLELTAVIMIIGLIAGLGITRFGHNSLGVTQGEGFVRKLALGLQLARRQAISEGVNAAVFLTRSDGNVTQWTVLRAASSGDETTELTANVPTNVSVTSPADRWEFDPTGQLVVPSGGGTVRVDAPGWYWNLQVYAAPGSVAVTRVAN